ncbi:hypothetical protein BLNAU_11510 [Blattamonas nauphoetae]|uniref:Uncharacterized protein n=1 Tax=Blattamonas nauphoetae TaxID=2049346 RepID=A0ABQ9XPU0_9EUKA|nr:hypothetical protein BLNAU_11510 [Blattamonas nauphoetae]
MKVKLQNTTVFTGHVKTADFNAYKKQLQALSKPNERAPLEYIDNFWQNYACLFKDVFLHCSCPALTIGTLSWPCFIKGESTLTAKEYIERVFDLSRYVSLHKELMTIPPDTLTTWALGVIRMVGHALVHLSKGDIAGYPTQEPASSETPSTLSPVIISQPLSKHVDMLKRFAWGCFQKKIIHEHELILLMELTVGKAKLQR